MHALSLVRFGMSDGRVGDDPERPMLRFTEDACVQCGLCAATCPENVITLKPQIDFRAITPARVFKEEDRSVASVAASLRRQKYD